jgi:hypothetical protein
MGGPDQLGAIWRKATARLNDPNDFARNQRYAQQLATAIDERRKAVAEDPADYVMSSPAVRPILARLDPNNPDPAVIRQVIAAGEAEQLRLGVPTDQVRPLTRRQAGVIVRGMAEADPATTDLAQLMSQAAERYGPHWNQVFGDLVKAGLPGFYQALAIMDRPEHRESPPRTCSACSAMCMTRAASPSSRKPPCPMRCVRSTTASTRRWRRSARQCATRSPTPISATRSSISPDSTPFRAANRLTRCAPPITPCSAAL